MRESVSGNSWGGDLRGWKNWGRRHGLCVDKGQLNDSRICYLKLISLEIVFVPEKYL